MSEFDKALKFVLSWEGKYSNDPDDKGGETYRGITRKNWPNWEGWKYVDLKEWDKADTYVRDFYYTEYWDKSGCEYLQPPFAIAVFDTAVNMHINRAKILLKNSNTWQDYIINRIARYNEIAKIDNNIKFLRGWINRAVALYRVIQKDNI